MKTLYKVAINILIFFFAVDLFSSFLKVGNGTFYEELIYAAAFSLLLLTVPHILLFFKIPVTEASEFLLSAAFSSLFFFLGYYIFNFIDLKGLVFDTKIPLLTPMSFTDKSIALIIVGSVTALLTTGIHYLNKKKKSSSKSLYS